MPKKKKMGKINSFKRLRFLASASSFSKIARFGHLAKYYIAKTSKWDMFKWGVRRG
jgi:hypothetical protein